MIFNYYTLISNKKRLYFSIINQNMDGCIKEINVFCRRMNSPLRFSLNDLIISSLLKCSSEIINSLNFILLNRIVYK